MSLRSARRGQLCKSDHRGGITSGQSGLEPVPRLGLRRGAFGVRAKKIAEILVSAGGSPLIFVQRESDTGPAEKQRAGGRTPALSLFPRDCSGSVATNRNDGVPRTQHGETPCRA